MSLLPYHACFWVFVCKSTRENVIGNIHPVLPLTLGLPKVSHLCFSTFKFSDSSQSQLPTFLYSTSNYKLTDTYVVRLLVCKLWKWTPSSVCLLHSLMVTQTSSMSEISEFSIHFLSPQASRTFCVSALELPHYDCLTFSPSHVLSVKIHCKKRVLVALCL